MDDRYTFRNRSKSKVLFGICTSVFFLIFGTMSLVFGDDWDKSNEDKWNAAFMETVARGEKLFHGPELGGNTVQCAMCHPNATNTHPETYPKFQKQIGKVSTLREMINWCIQNPLQGKPLAYDDPKMIALEAYIMYERRNSVLVPGKH